MTPAGKVEIYFEEWDGSEIVMSEELLLLAASQAQTRDVYRKLLRTVGTRKYKVKEKDATS